LVSPYRKIIICFANSRKPSGRCVAGKVIDGSNFGGWVRPVSARPAGELSASDRHYDGGIEPCLLDVVEIALSAKSAHQYQPENHTIDDNYYWDLQRKATFSEAIAALDPIKMNLWGVSYGSSYSGQNDRVPLADAPGFNSSLRLIRVNNLKIQVSAEGASFGNMKRKLRGYFTYSFNQYGLSVTDPVTESQYLLGKDGLFPVGEAMLYVSLSEPHQGHAYKLIAGVILP
jgi:hypothetical protein